MTLCNYCGNKDENKLKIQLNDNLYMCIDCLKKVYSNCMKKDNAIKISKFNDNIPKPNEIINYLDKYVVGQEKAKKVLAVAAYNHLKRIRYNLNNSNNDNNDNVEIEKSNIIMVGPTGSGKTYLIKILAKFLDVPFAIQDATSLTAAGFVGDDVENVLRKLINNADGDVKKAEHGIVFLDEIDKIGRKSENPSISKDVGGEETQNALLKLMEGTIASVPPQGGRKHPTQECIDIDTSNILFICGGAFEGIEEIIANRLNGKKSMGFGATITDKNDLKINDYIHKTNVEDLKKYGLMPEFLGRLPILVTLEQLDVNALVKILTEPKNALLKQYEVLFKEDFATLNISDKAIKNIANKAIETKTGARSLRRILEDLFLDTMLEIPNKNNVNVNVYDDLTIKVEEGVSNNDYNESTYRNTAISN